MDYGAVKLLISSLEGEAHLEYETILVYSTGLSIDALLYDFDYYVNDKPSRIARPRPIPLEPEIHKAVLKSFEHFNKQQQEEERTEEPTYLETDVDREAKCDHNEIRIPLSEESQHLSTQREATDEHTQAPEHELAPPPFGHEQQDTNGSNTTLVSTDSLILSVLHAAVKHDQHPYHGAHKSAIADLFPSFAFPCEYGLCSDDDLTDEEHNIRQKCRRYRFCGSALDNAVCTHFLKYRPFTEDLKYYFRRDFEKAKSIHDVFKRQHKHFLALRRQTRKRDRERIKTVRRAMHQVRDNSAQKKKKKLASSPPIRPPEAFHLRRSERLCKHT